MNCFATPERPWLAVATVLLSAVANVSAAGVTIVTHGFNSDVESWIIPMAEVMPQHPAFRGSTFSCYQMTIEESGGQYVATREFLGGVLPPASDSGEIFIKLDWSSLSSFGGASTAEIAASAAAALLATNFMPALAGRALAHLPLHLIGHSRGASVVTEMARMLGAQGVWVDQVTMLDPRPVSELGDPALKNYANILFADNYWQDMGDGLFVPNGQFVPGAYNRKLTSLSGGYSSSHSDVHHWYHGTIDFRPFTVDGASVSASERASWWTSAEQRGTNAGFRWSRIGGGDRRSEAQPGGAGEGRIRDGWRDLTVDVPANRIALPLNNGAWPNPIVFQHGATNTVPVGEPVGFTLSHQSGSNQNAIIELRLFLDPDANPFNTNEIEALQTTIAATGNSALASTNGFVQPDAGGVLPGTYRLLVRLTDGPRARVLYAPGQLSFTTSLLPPRLTPLGMSNNHFGLRIDGYAGQRVVLDASEGFAIWTPLATNTLSGAGVMVSDPVVGASHRFYRARLLP